MDDMEIYNRLATIPQEIEAAENAKLHWEEMLGLFWEHPPALDPEFVGARMQVLRDRIRGLQQRISGLLQERNYLIVCTIEHALQRQGD
ncbi:hypothetical protein AtNW77_MTg0323281 (mitochondrion) [Arabidopsis thaliana]|jgi:hypothetical protein|uniref:Uncharacterized protein n=5 Tax=Arabidopsis TaxID=3701 RepID=Q1G3Q9_ARATH|nr:uncharacterized protein AT2G07820 [Arabidopsis thaliana]KAG7528052.1 hypothetical protein ISN44_Un228g000080 [Arabidopsis suecica]KAG7529272.1 hypothetical protein ISN45_Un97g000570 [Arabidopsis thaliana x Arabidopsis arenosa]ABF59342.1 unknown protein [Arabidopsis thaliana]AEC06110.1 hypothetical protein AT2G07820 [Arabidopsis thaliana]KAG7529321.1 hypothetical protein ISN44_Un143g000060 [Arabidopsis suecica]|eukprot:NP_001118287.1 hypothetical protein AT2G07820 [Arabidopsis thaliana]